MHAVDSFTDPVAFAGACRDLVELVTHYLDGALPAPVALAVEEHLSTCDDCARYVDQFRATIAATGRLRLETINPRAQLLLVQAFRDVIGTRAARGPRQP
jgi:anti-sigma factor RsiW